MIFFGKYYGKGWRQMQSQDYYESRALNKIMDEMDVRIGYEMNSDCEIPDLGTNTFQEEAIRMGIMVKTPREFKSRTYILKSFIIAKKFEGCTAQTINGYYDVIGKFMDSTDKYPLHVTTQDVREYLMRYQDAHKVTNRTLDGMRSSISSFYNWLEDEGYILKNPVKRIKKIKWDKIIKQPFTSEEIEKIRDACRNVRDLSIIDFLYSTGCRVSEVAMLDIADLNFASREVIVFGKGHKERVVYFDVRAKRNIEKYLSRRTDRNPALFVTQKYPYKRLEKSGIEYICSELGEKAGVVGCHPHRFRRTLATNLIYRGVPIEQVQVILGHTKIDTTLLYSNVNQESVKMNHTRFV